ncbi:hypothetical protein FSARC_3693 [Fusarium sarcochroum]|uniref:Uncharacterized protein n=1 Tax=Fusarium sarcochroum TaxID=1208366 RepID=A0A8H4U3Y4_9HYPO|nr:hypothetical protein FSARC_3693 [Fusarium sarcochroum]
MSRSTISSASFDTWIPCKDVVSLSRLQRTLQDFYGPAHVKLREVDGHYVIATLTNHPPTVEQILKRRGVIQDGSSPSENVPQTQAGPHTPKSDLSRLVEDSGNG